MNILIVDRERSGFALLAAMEADRNDWRVVSYGGSLLAHKAKNLVIVRPKSEDFSGLEKETVDRWFSEDVPHMKMRAERVLEI